MKTLLPRWLQKPPDKTSTYYDGHYAQQHDRGFYLDEHQVGIALALLERAGEALRIWRNNQSPLPPSAAADLKTAFESLDGITWHLPRIKLWCVWTHYKDGWSDAHVVWSAHLSLFEARQWLPLWQKKLAHRTDYGWHVGLHECDIRDVRDPEMPVPKELS